MKGYFRKRGSKWEFEVRLHRNEMNEWVKTFKGGFRTKKEAEAACAELINQAEHGEFAIYQNMNVESYMNMWLNEYCKHNLKSSTFANRQNMVLKRIVPGLGKWPLEKLMPIHFTRFYNSMHEEGLSSDYIHSIHSCLRTAMKHAVKWKIASRNMMEDVDAPKIEKSKKLHTWTMEESSEFLKFTKSIENEYKHIAFVLAIYTGMRRGEILGLRWSDIDFERQTLQVVQTVYKPMNTAPTIQEPKTASAKRSISIPEIAIQELKTHKAKQNRLKLLYGEAYCDHGLVCPRPDGNPMDPRGLNEHFENCIRKSGLPKIRFHDLRHTHATIMLQLGQHPKVVSERLGHANVNITMNTYSHVMPNMQSDAAKKFNEAFKNIGD